VVGLLESLEEKEYADSETQHRKETWNMLYYELCGSHDNERDAVV
jgi:hypothetical protein